MEFAGAEVELPLSERVCPVVCADFDISIALTPFGPTVIIMGLPSPHLTTAAIGNRFDTDTSALIAPALIEPDGENGVLARTRTYFLDAEFQRFSGQRWLSSTWRL